MSVSYAPHRVAYKPSLVTKGAESGSTDATVDYVFYADAVFVSACQTIVEYIYEPPEIISKISGLAQVDLMLWVSHNQKALDPTNTFVLEANFDQLFTQTVNAAIKYIAPRDSQLVQAAATAFGFIRPKLGKVTFAVKLNWTKPKSDDPIQINTGFDFGLTGDDTLLRQLPPAGLYSASGEEEQDQGSSSCVVTHLEEDGWVNVGMEEGD